MFQFPRYVKYSKKVVRTNIDIVLVLLIHVIFGQNNTESLLWHLIWHYCIAQVELVSRCQELLLIFCTGKKCSTKYKSFTQSMCTLNSVLEVISLMAIININISCHLTLNYIQDQDTDQEQNRRRNRQRPR